MKRLIALCALALSSTVFASTSTPPPNVDTTGWKAKKFEICMQNGVKEVTEIFSISDDPLHLMIQRISFGDKVVAETHSVISLATENGFAFLAYYLKPQDTWIQYSKMEWDTVLREFTMLRNNYFSGAMSEIACPTQ